MVGAARPRGMNGDRGWMRGFAGARRRAQSGPRMPRRRQVKRLKISANYFQTIDFAARYANLSPLGGGGASSIQIGLFRGKTPCQPMFIAGFRSRWSPRAAFWWAFCSLDSSASDAARVAARIESSSFQPNCTDKSHGGDIGSPDLALTEEIRMKGFEIVKGWARELVDIMILFVALGVLVQIIFGTESTGFFGKVTSNLMTFVNQLGQGGFVGLVALLVIISIFSKRTHTNN
jgi:hypothetical protein